MEGERSCQRVSGGQFNGGIIVMLWRWPVYRRENGCYRGGLFNGGGMVRLKRWPVQWRENGFVIKAACLMEGEWSC